MSVLDQLRSLSTVVADTGDLASIQKFRPQDTTTNPSIVLNAVKSDPSFLKNTLAEHSKLPVNQITEQLLVTIGAEILKIIPGRVSTEVDARCSFDTQATIEKAREIIRLYKAKGIGPERVLIKIASTWEGIQAAKVLEKEGIHCTMTLIFCLEQAIACAEVGATLISPFVGRILDWYQANKKEILVDGFDPGVESVRRIYSYYKKFGYKTEIMGASFRNVNEIKALAGCGLLTIAPKFLDELSAAKEQIGKQIEEYHEEWPAKMAISEPCFRFSLNENQMASDKLAEGIRLFCRDTRQLEDLIKTSMN
jgi:transaldolase